MKYILVGALSASMVGEVLRSIYNCKMVLVKSTRLYKYAVYLHILIDKAMYIVQLQKGALSIISMYKICSQL